MAAKRKATKAGAGVWATGKAVRNNPYLERLAGDEELRNNLRTAFASSRKAYARMANGRGPQAIVDDKKTRKQLKDAAGSLREAAETLRGAGQKRRRKRRGGLILFVLVGAGAAVALNEGLRKRALDLLFGAEEEFEYSSSTTAPDVPPPPAAEVDDVPPPPSGEIGFTPAPAGAAGSPPVVPPEGPIGTS
ncbi:MAG: hypothetical protein H0U12_04720 [Thermoleophilaceae bacterium]|nr:hypothetical protein [Thermoleophilaceae bacterium]